MVLLLFIYPLINTDSVYHIDKFIHLDFLAGVDAYEIQHDFFLLTTSVAFEQTVYVIFPGFIIIYEIIFSFL